MNHKNWGLNLANAVNVWKEVSSHSEAKVEGNAEG
jgi:hypothetical protein